MSQNFIKVFLSFPHVFLGANQNRVSRNFIEVFFLIFNHVSSQPIKGQCLRISSKYFSIFRTFPRSQSKASVSEFHQSIFQFSARFLAANQNRVSRNFIKVFFSNFPHGSSQPIKSQCLRISSKFFSIFRTFPRSQSKASVSEFHQSIFQFSARFLAANQNRMSRNFIKVFFQIFLTFDRSQSNASVSELHQSIF